MRPSFVFAFCLALACAAQADPRYGSVLVKGAPDSAVVFLDGAVYGKAPIVIKRVTPGRHQLLVYAQGYQFMQRDVEVRTGLRATCTLTLEPLGSGIASIARPPAVVKLWSPPVDHGGTGGLAVHGLIYVLALIDTAGRAAAADVVRGSGDKQLDARLIDAVRRSTFTPALGSDGKPAPDYVVVPFNFK